MAATIALGVAVTLVVLGLLARLRVRHLNITRDLQDDFFKAAGVLIDDDDTPESIVDSVEVLARLITHRSAPWLMLGLLIDGEMKKSIQSPSEKQREHQISVKTLRKPLDEQYGKVAASFILAITYNSTLIGWILRRVALYRVSKVNKRHYDGGDDAELLAYGLTCR